MLATPAMAQIGVLKTTTISASGQTATVNLSGVQSVGIDVDNAGTYTLVFEASMDGGFTYTTVGTVDNSDYTNDTGTTGPGNWSFANLGWSHFRVRASAYTSGTPVVRLVRGYGGVTAPLSAGSVSGSNSAAGATGSAVPAQAGYTGINVGGTHRGWTGFSVGSQFAAGVAIVDGSGNQITSFGGGTQYAEGATAATITGTAMMFETNTGTNTLGVVSSTNPVPVTGTVTANAGTNLNTSALLTTAAHDAVFGTAGTADTQVQTVQGIAGMTPVQIADNAGSITVDNSGTFAVQAAQSGTWNVRTQDGSGNALTSATRGAERALSVQIVDSSGNQVSSFGGSGGTAIAEDVASANADPGTPAYTVRNDTVTGATSADGDYQPLKSDSAGRLYTTGIGGTFPATQSGTWTVQPGNTANTTAWLVTGTGGTFPATQSGTWNVTNISGTVSLPTGAATSANQSTEITALQLIDNPVGGGSGGAGGTAGTNSMLAGGVYNSTPPTLTNGQQAGLQLSSSGALIVTGAAGTTQYAEDAAHASGDQTVFVGTIRRDTTPSASAGTAGDYAALNTDANGRLYTQAVLYNSSGTELTLANDKAEDTAHADGDQGPAVMSRRIDTAASSAGASGDYATFNTDSLGRLWTRPGQPCADHARIQSAVIDTSTSGNVEVVALNGSDLIYICGVDIVVGSTATAVQLIYGTGTACGTGETNLTGAWPFGANGGISKPNAGVPQYIVPAGNAFCVELSAANPIAGSVTYVRTAAP